MWKPLWRMFFCRHGYVNNCADPNGDGPWDVGLMGADGVCSRTLC